jgi:hypothetical protein
MDSHHENKPLLFFKFIALTQPKIVQNLSIFVTMVPLTIFVQNNSASTSQWPLSESGRRPQ